MNEPGLRWSTRPAAVAALGVGAAVLVVAAVVAATDPTGRVLVGLAALLASALTLLAVRQRPRLEVLADDAGIATTRLTGRREYPRGALHRVRIVDYPRLGRRVPMLEIDAVDAATGRETLLIFGRWELGTDPREVYDALAVHGLVPDQTPS